MPSRSLAALSLGVLLAVAGCLGGAAAPDATTATDPLTSATTTTASSADTATDATNSTPTSTPGTTREPCSRDANVTLSGVSKPANLTEATAREVAETVESRYQAVRVDEHSYFNHHVRSAIEIEEIADGYRVGLRAELDYDRRGGENATVVHVRRPYSVTYRVTGRAVVRQGEAGVSGTVVCQ